MAKFFDNRYSTSTDPIWIDDTIWGNNTYIAPIEKKKPDKKTNKRTEAQENLRRAQEEARKRDQKRRR